MSRNSVKIGAWLSVPMDEPVHRGMVIGHGYGGREGPDEKVPWKNMAIVYPCARGFGLSCHPLISGIANHHVIKGIENRDTYIHGDCICDYWLSLSALLQLYPNAGANISFLGMSFSGGIGAFVVAWDKRIHRAALNFPSFGAHKLRLELPCLGSGEAVRRRFQTNPEIAEVLRYYDAAFAAEFISVPVISGLALFDPCVPPPGQFAVFNAIKSERELYLFSVGHHSCFIGDHENEDYHKHCVRFFEQSVP